MLSNPVDSHGANDAHLKIEDRDFSGVARSLGPAHSRVESDCRTAYREARRHIERIDCLVRALDDRREELGMSQAELARRTQLAPDLVRRLLTVSGLNPPIGTLTAIADALHLELVPRRRAS
jgi:DNA-binding phage protein